MHGFDLETRTVSFPRRWVIIQHLAAAVALLAVGIGARLVAPMVAAVAPPEVTATIGTVLMSIALVPVLTMLAYIVWGRRYQRRFRDGRFPLPRRRWALRTRPP